MGSGIYKIINVINNKFYVGSSVDLRKRKSKHFSELRHAKHNNKHLQRAWDKYGESSFIFVIIEELTRDDDLLAAENIWLKPHVGKNYCYNIGRDATAPSLGMCGELSPTWGRKRTPEELAAQSFKGKKHREESKEKIRTFLIGKPKSTEVRAKISATLSGAGNPNFGKPRSKEFVEKVSKVVTVVYKGEATEYPSISALRTALNMTPPQVNRALKSRAPISKGKFEGMRIEYVK
jgi:group I intron endonuclease